MYMLNIWIPNSNILFLLLMKFIHKIFNILVEQTRFNFYVTIMNKLFYN